MELGLPAAQCNEMSALTLLALANLTKSAPWEKVKPVRLRIHDMLVFIQQKYKRKYAENTRETIRRQVIHQFEQARIVNRNPDEPGLATNSPRTHYALSDEIVSTLQTYGTRDWKQALRKFLSARTTLSAMYLRKRRLRMIPVRISGNSQLHLSPGKHNLLQAAVVEEFAPRFAPGAHLLYLGDTAKKMLYVDDKRLARLTIPANEHDKLPDVVLFEPKSNRLFLIEAVTSHGPVSPKRHLELEKILAHINVSRVYVSAFPDFKEFKTHIANIAWDTEVWISAIPDHLIHFNGDRFLP